MGSYIFIEESSKQAKGKFVTFLVCPILSFALAIKSIQTRSSFVIFMLFAALFGFCLYVPAEKGLEALSVDSTYYRQFFEQLSINESFSEYCRRFLMYIHFELDLERGEIIKDYYLETVFYFSSLFTRSHRLAFMICAVVFTFFMLKSLKFLILQKDFKLSYYTLCLLLIFSFNQIICLHWLRFPTASWIAVYMIFQVYVNNNKRYWYLLPVTILVHGSFFAFALIILLVEITRKYTNFWTALFFLSFLISSIPQDIIDGLGKLMPGPIGAYFMYASEDTMTERADLVSERRTGLLIQLFGVVLNVYMNILMLYIIKQYKKINYKENLFTVLLALFTIVNIFAFVKEFSERYRFITYPLLVYVWYKLFPLQTKKSRIILFAPIVFAYQMALYGYLYYMTCGYPLFVTPFFTLSRYLISGDI